MANIRLDSKFLAGRGRTYTQTLMWCLWISLYICYHLGYTEANLEEGGNILVDEVVEGPVFLKKTAIVRQGVTVTIRPGSVLTFAPGVMLAVNGTLIAEGTENERIRFTGDPGPGNEVPTWASDIRLVDEPSVMEGRLQLLYNGKWRGVCANSVNWTKTDANVTCRELGFREGIFYFRSWARNDSHYMLYQRPTCFGKEESVTGCPGAPDIKIGSHICANQQTVHLKCNGIDPEKGRGYWWGLEFYNSTLRTSVEGSTRINESASRFKHVDILYAGVAPDGEPVPAVRAQPLAPHLLDVTIRYSALDATNFTNVKSSTIVHNSQISHNRGHGLVVETHYGRVRVTNSQIHDNAGNGIKAKFLDGRWPFFNRAYTFCNMANIGSQQYPVVMVGVPTDIRESCERVFETQYGHVLTLVVLEMDIVDEAKGSSLEVYDGRYSYDRKIGTYPIINGTLPQGITSTYKYMLIRFNWKRPKAWPNCHLLRDCVKFTIMVDSGPATVPEFHMTNSRVDNNLQHGAFLENLRNYAYINASQISHNQYGAGVRVYGGAADVHINSSTVDYNQDNGINITYDGGYRIFNRSSVSNNYGNGINITFNETRVDNKSRVAKHQRTEVYLSDLNYNDGWGVRVGNYCRTHSAVINDSFFEYNMRDAIELESCYKIIKDDVDLTNFTVGYNKFHGNFGHAVKIKPMINVVGRIGNNTFREHPRHVLVIDNGEDYLENRFYSYLKVDYSITGNEFYENRGYYVANLRLSQGSTIQKLVFKYNRLRENVIEGSFPGLNERSRAYAVVIVSSSNVNVSRNHLVNTGSKYEIATHLLDQTTLEASRQWWGTINYTQIIERIFDQFNRYDLAYISYHPVLKYDDLYGEWVTDTQRPEEVAFSRGDRLGGRLAVNFITHPSRTKYIVDRDISILPDGTLTVRPGTTLEFQNSLGMLVRGELKADGREDGPIVFRMANVSKVLNNSFARLVDGPDMFSGRLEIRPSENDTWGTVCSEGWTIADASVVCQMLGMVVHPDGWWPKDINYGYPSQPIWRSQVKCTELDMDITMCKGDGRDDHSCNHTMDVAVTCKPATWAGIHFRATARPSILRHVTVTDAGLMDPTAITYSPAIKIDYNVHTADHLTVTNTMHNGIDILHNDAYANAKLSNSEVSNNMGSGVVTHGPFFEVHFSNISDNVRKGFEYNPHYTALEAQRMRAGIHDPHVIGPDFKGPLIIPDQGYMFLTTVQDTTPEIKVYNFELKVNERYKVVVDVLDYNPDTSQEKVTVFDSPKDKIRDTTVNWKIEEDLVDFPIVSTSTHVTIRWDVKGPVSGRLTFAVRSKPWDWDWPWPDVKVKNSTILNNQIGIETRHYNQPSNEYLDLFFRYRWQTIQLYGVEIRGSRQEALHVPSITKYHELYMPSFEELQQMPFRVAEITYSIDSCHVVGNGAGIMAEHNHVEFSNNVWLWEVTNNLVERNKAGGFNILLPKVNLMYQELYNHSVDVNDTVFTENDMFEFRIDGFYCNSSISRNRFQANKCRMGCITLSGTEKDLDIFDNEVVENSGWYIMEFNMNSHTPYTRWVEARMMDNNFKRNTRQEASLSHPSSSPSSYTLGVKGVQNVTINRNLFANEKLDYELVAGQSSSVLENFLDVTENWWGTDDQVTIQKRIFDFDDWNSYAIAEYFPFLLYDKLGAPISTGKKLDQNIDLSEFLGGRIEGPLTLRKRSEPYVVKRDLTIMPLGSLFIDAGVELQFYPNVGILVLGGLTALGKEDNRIKMGPVPAEKMERWRRATPEENGSVRLNSGNSPNEGFVEIYNSTERRWTIICDSNFNDKTGEVACRSMGMESSNVVVRRSQYYDHFVLGYPLMHEQRLEWFWRRTLICDGREPNINRCRYKVNYNLLRCMEERQYVFMRCGSRNLASKYEYWGNLRFSTAEYEHGSIRPGFSVLEYVDIYGAGILHEEKVAAVQAVHRTPSTVRVRITNCAWNGYDFIAPRDEFKVSYNTINNNNGYGIGGLVLNGESRYEVPQSSFTPLTKSDIPYNVFGLVRMCTAEKLIYVQDRILLYHKYDFETIDCIKIIRSREPRKQVALRFLQLNLYNDTFYKNAVEMYNGEYFDAEMKIGEVTANSSEYQRSVKFETSEYYDVMGVRVTASPAHGDHGFIAEVVTLPLSPGWKPDLGPGQRQQILRTTMTGNQGGGFKFSNAGELNPSVQIEGCLVQNCGYKLLNITSPPVIDLYVQNSKLLTIANNFLDHNGGGITVFTYTNSLSTAIYANVTNNVITHNTHGPNMHIEGHHYQGFEVRSNYIANNDVEYHNNIAMFGINLNFTDNIIWNNYGRSTLNATVPKKVAINQRYHANSFFDNKAIGGNQTTIFLGSAKHSFERNYFFNWWNIYEMVTFNRTKDDDAQLSQWPDQEYPEVHAMNNWWGSGNPASIRGRIWDRWDDDNLIRVKFEPYFLSNSSVMQGRCETGWRLYESRCYLYMGGVVPYREAQRQCALARGRLAWKRDRDSERFLGEMVASRQENYDHEWGAWVFDDWREQDTCTAVVNYQIAHLDCSLILPFVCETDPYVSPKFNWWYVIIPLIVVGCLLILVVILCGLSLMKARKRKDQRLERRNSLRRSIRSSKQSIYANQHAIQRADTASIHSATDRASQKRRRPPLGKVGMLDLSGVTLNDTSTDTIDKEKLYAARPGTPASIDYSGGSSSKPDVSSSYFDSDLQDYYPNRLENEIPNISRPTFDHVMRNEAFEDDRSLDRSRLTGTPSRVYPYGGAGGGGRGWGTSTSSEFGLDDRPRPKPKETAM